MPSQIEESESMYLYTISTKETEIAVASILPTHNTSQNDNTTLKRKFAPVI